MTLPLDQYFTRPLLAARIAAWVAQDITPGQRWLEPSAGDGSLAGALMTAIANRESVGTDDCSITAVETDKKMFAKLKSRFLGLNVRVINADFTTFEPRPGDEWSFDGVLMNPPYSKGLDGIHVGHAISFAPRVVALVVDAFEHGSKRQARVFSKAYVDRRVVLVTRPSFYGPGDKGVSARRNYVVLDLKAGQAPMGHRVHSERWVEEQE